MKTLSTMMLMCAAIGGSSPLDGLIASHATDKEEPCPAEMSRVARRIQAAEEKRARKASRR